MSRSRKKHPIRTQQHNFKKQAKRLANKRARRKLEIANGKAYRKVSESWDITDWKIDFTGDEHEQVGRRK